MSTATDEASIFRILVSTDNHVGYLEKDPIRGNDSFDSFEEMLKIAQREQVDFILLGGDLFHHNKPSRRTMHRVMELLRKYTLGDRPIRVQLHSDQKVNFGENFGRVNYEDPNFNVALPVFSIHGNHDDPAGDGVLSALDLLSVSNLVNYFGKSPNVDEVTIYPLLFSKGDTKLAVYGLGNIRDERLYRTFQSKKVKLMRPVENRDDWFNVFVIHQNRVAHGPKSYIHEEMLENFIDFVIWGHEHECLITPTSSTVGSFWISQPGSSVATSLCPAEAVPKHVGVLEVMRSNFRMRSIPLNTVRPMIIDTVTISDEDAVQGDAAAIADGLEEKVREMIAEATKELHPDTPSLPLVRLRVEHGGNFSISPTQFGQRFVGQVANPDDILLFMRRKATGGGTRGAAARGGGDNADDGDVDGVIGAMLGDHQAEDPRTKMASIINSVLSEERPTSILLEKGMGDALHDFVEKDDKSAFDRFIGQSLKRMETHLKKQDREKLGKAEDVEQLAAGYTGSLRKRAGIFDSDAPPRSSSKTTTTTSNAAAGDGKDDDDLSEERAPAKTARVIKQSPPSSDAKKKKKEPARRAMVKSELKSTPRTTRRKRAAAVLADDTREAKRASRAAAEREVVEIDADSDFEADADDDDDDEASIPPSGDDGSEEEQLATSSTSKQSPLAKGKGKGKGKKKAATAASASSGSKRKAKASSKSSSKAASPVKKRARKAAAEPVKGEPAPTPRLRGRRGRAAQLQGIL